MVCATISPKTICSVKFLDPTTILLLERLITTALENARPAKRTAATAITAPRDRDRRLADRCRSSHKKDTASTDPPPPNPDPPFCQKIPPEPQQAPVNGKRQQRRGNGARENHGR